MQQFHLTEWGIFRAQRDPNHFFQSTPAPFQGTDDVWHFSSAHINQLQIGSTCRVKPPVGNACHSSDEGCGSSIHSPLGHCLFPLIISKLAITWLKPAITFRYQYCIHPHMSLTTYNCFPSSLLKLVQTRLPLTQSCYCDTFGILHDASRLEVSLFGNNIQERERNYLVCTRIKREIRYWSLPKTAGKRFKTRL